MNAPHDQNFVRAKLGVLCTNGVSLVPIAISSNGGVMVDGTSTISVAAGSIDYRDENYRPCWMAQNSVDGSPIPIYVNSSGAILVST